MNSKPSLWLSLNHSWHRVQEDTTCPGWRGCIRDARPEPPTPTLSALTFLSPFCRAGSSRTKSGPVKPAQSKTSGTASFHVRVHTPIKCFPSGIRPRHKWASLVAQWCRRLRFYPWVLGSIPGSGGLGWSPGEGNGTRVFLSGKSIDRGAWRVTVHGVTKSQTQLSTHAKG